MLQIVFLLLNEHVLSSMECLSYLPTGFFIAVKHLLVI